MSLPGPPGAWLLDGSATPMELVCKCRLLCTDVCVCTSAVEDSPFPAVTTAWAQPDLPARSGTEERSLPEPPQRLSDSSPVPRGALVCAGSWDRPIVGLGSRISGFPLPGAGQAPGPYPSCPVLYPPQHLPGGAEVSWLLVLPGTCLLCKFP